MLRIASKKIGAGLRCLVFACTALPTATAGNTGWPGWGHVTEIYANSYWTTVAFDGIAINSGNYVSEGCDWGGYFALALNDPNYQAMLSLLVTAQSTNREVTVWLQGCGGANNNYPRIISVRMR